MNKIIKNKEDAPYSFYQRFRAFVRNILFIKPKNIEDVTEVALNLIAFSAIENATSSIISDDRELSRTSVTSSIFFGLIKRIFLTKARNL